jgi:ParB family transcriptional regulator, chromosome partitioning protein
VIDGLGGAIGFGLCLSTSHPRRAGLVSLSAPLARTDQQGLTAAAHPTLRELLGLDTASVYGGGRQAAEHRADQQVTPKAATMTTLAAVVTVWEASTGKHTWRNPNSWDARVLGALAKWGASPARSRASYSPPQPPTTQPTDDEPVAA